MYGIHYKIIGKCIRRNSTTKGMIFKMMKKGAMTKNATKATKKIGELKLRITLSVTLQEPQILLANLTVTTVPFLRYLEKVIVS